MATRQVTTVFAVEGERDYKQAIKNINAEIKLLDSELDLLSERYQNNEGSVHALRQKMSELQDIYTKQNEKLDILVQAYDAAVKNIQRYKEECDRLKTTISENREQLEKFREAGEGSSEAAKTLAKETAELEKSLNNNATHYQTSMRNAADFATQANETRITIEKLGKEIDQTSVYLTEAENSADGYAHSLDETADAAENMGAKITASIDAITASLAAAGIERSFEKIRDTMQECREKSLEFETSLTGVFKTVSGSAEELKAVEDGIKNLALEIPATTTEIASVAETAGQLGIATKDIIEFTEVMMKLGTATNLSATEGATSLARFANITGMSADDYERLGSTVVDLGNKFATTEEEIVALATRMAATGDMVGMNESDMLAYAAAISSVGIEAEAGGSAISKLFKRIEEAVAVYDVAKEAIDSTGEEIRDLELLQSNHPKTFKSIADDIGLTSTELSSYIKNVRELEDYATIASMKPGEFIQSWEDNAAAALEGFIAGLGQIEEESGNAVLTLEEMGITEVRLSNAVLALSSAQDLLERTLDTASEAWERNTALSDEAAKRYETDASKAAILQNAIEQLEVALGDDFNNTLEPAIEGLTGFTAALADAAEESPTFSAGVAGIGGALAGLTGLTVAAAGIKAISTALAVFGTTAGPVALAVTAISGIATAAAVYKANVEELSEASDEIITQNDRLLQSVKESKSAYDTSNESIDLNREKVEHLTEKIFMLTSEMEQTPAAQAIVQGAVDELNSILPGLGLTYDTVTGQINMTRDALIEFANEAEDTARLDALKQYMQDLTGQSVDLEIKGDITSQQIETAKQKYEEATQAVADFTQEQTWLEKILNYTNPSFIELKESAAQAKNELDELTESQKNIETALSDVNSELEATQKVYDDYVEGLKENGDAVKVAGEEVGSAYVDGMIKGLEDKREELRLKASALGNIVSDSTRGSLDINSPSKVAEEIGRYFGDGLALGLEESEGKVRDAAEALAGKFDISADVSAQFRKAQSEISTMSFKPSAGGMDFDGYRNAVREMNRAAMGTAAYASGMHENERVANITIVQQLDGKVLSREVSRVQFNDTKLTARARGMR